eukprot:5850729-Pleurochrysis_carterae.AAC.1
MACVLAERSRSASGFLAPVRTWPTSPCCAPASKPPCSTITNNHFPAHTGWSLQSDPIKYLQVRYTPNEGVRSPDWVARSALSDCAVTNGGIAVDYSGETPL